MDADDEFPLVPFLFGPGGENFYDSSAIAEWFDARQANGPRLLPTEPGTRFVVRLLDEYADEWGLYLMHHQRWVCSAGDNDAGTRLGREFGSLFGPLRHAVGSRFAARQVRRLPYLFSVASPHQSFDHLPANRRPPSRAGFPPTHALLNEAFKRQADALEQIFAVRPTLLGSGFTLADASVYGQIGANFDDPSVAARMRQRWPATARWTQGLRAGTGPDSVSPTMVGDPPAPLLKVVGRYFVPLMRQNAVACRRLRAQGVTRFNEAAFNRGTALYDGVIAGHPYRGVAKTFQAKVWKRLVAEWHTLLDPVRERLAGQGIDPAWFADEHA